MKYHCMIIEESASSPRTIHTGGHDSDPFLAVQDAYRKITSRRTGKATIKVFDNNAHLVFRLDHEDGADDAFIDCRRAMAEKGLVTRDD
jgi:hypothetical protein